MAWLNEQIGPKPDFLWEQMERHLRVVDDVARHGRRVVTYLCDVNPSYSDREILEFTDRNCWPYAAPFGGYVTRSCSCDRWTIEAVVYTD